MTFLSILKGARVERVYTIVSWNDRPLLGFFEKSGFAPGGSLVSGKENAVTLRNRAERTPESVMQERLRVAQKNDTL